MADGKWYGRSLPSPANPGSTICFKMTVPDALQYRAALMGQINFLGLWQAWRHQLTDIIPPENVVAAELWMEAASTAVFEECVMDICEQILLCITDDPTVQAAIINQVINSQAFRDAVQGIAGPGSPMTGPQIEALIGDECDEDTAFGGWTALVRQMDTNNRDLFERIEVGTNALERSNIVISAIPGIGVFPADEILGFLDSLINDLAENYAAQYTTTVEDEMRCGLFCLALDNDCGLNFDQLFNYFNERLGSSFTVESLFLDILSFIGAGTWSGTQIVDAMMLFQVAVLRHASKFIDFAVYSLQTTYALGLNDPDPDWSILCDCTPPPGCDGDDFLIDEQGWEALDGPTYSTYHPDEGWGKGSTTPQRIGIKKSYGTLISKVTVTFNTATTGVIDVGAFSYAYPPAFGSITHGSPTTEWVLEFTPGSGGIALDYRVGVLDPIPDGLRIICVKVE